MKKANITVCIYSNREKVSDKIRDALKKKPCLVSVVRTADELENMLNDNKPGVLFFNIDFEEGTNVPVLNDTLHNHTDVTTILVLPAGDIHLNEIFEKYTVFDFVQEDELEPVLLEHMLERAIVRKTVGKGDYYEQLYRKSPLAIIILNADDILLEANEGFETLFKYSIEEVIGRDINEIAVPEDLLTEAGQISITTLRGESVYSETVRKRKDGILVDVAIYTTPIFLQNGEPGIYCIYNDITDRVVAETALARSEARFRKIIEGSFDVIYELDNRGRITFVSPTLERITGFKPEEVLGEEFGSLVTEKSVSKKEMVQIYRLFREGKPLEGFQTRAYKKGEPESRIVEINASPIVEKDVVIGSRGIIRDITKRKQTELILKKQKQELLKLNENLNAANTELESFSYSVSHDLRAPIRHIGGFINLLKKRLSEEEDEKSIRYIDLIDEAAHKMGILIDDLLNFSRTGRSELKWMKVPLEEMAKNVAEQFHTEIEERNIDFKIDDLPEVECDVTLMRQVFQNLLSNAIKYTRNRDNPVIEISNPMENEDEYIISVRDNGVGFDMKYKNKLFGVFQRLHSDKEFEGTGIGLAIVRKIINRHGGKTWAESYINKGATFYFSIPKDIARKELNHGNEKNPPR